MSSGKDHRAPENHKTKTDKTWNDVRVQNKEMSMRSVSGSETIIEETVATSPFRSEEIVLLARKPIGCAISSL